MEMRISEAEERREENSRRNGEVLASLGFDINESKRRRVVVSSSTTARRGIKWTLHLDENELTHLYHNASNQKTFKIESMWYGVNYVNICV